MIGGRQERDYSNFRTLGVANRSEETWKHLYEMAEREEEEFHRKAEKELQPKIIPNEADNYPNEKVNMESFQLNKQYIIRQIKSALVIIDQHAAHVRILYEKYMDNLTRKSGLSQSCLFPQHLDLNPSDYQLVTGIKNELRRLGFEFESFGKRKIVVTGRPAELSGTNEKEIFEGLLEQFKNNKQKLEIELNDNIARSMAVKMARKKGETLQKEESYALVDQLFACKQPNYSPMGNPTYVVLGLNKIEDFFKER